jgi:hypothetical protein
MNIFLLDYDQELCARYHCDKHVVKMIVEYAQLLSTAHRLLDGMLTEVEYITKSGFPRKKKVWSFLPHPDRPDRREAVLYKVTHANHPCAVWARASLGNYYWLASLLNNLCAEYTYRYGKVHKVQSSGLLRLLERHPKLFLKKAAPTKITKRPQTMPDEFMRDNPVEAYRAFYLGSKMRFAKWTNRPVPPFVSEAYENTTPFERTR